MTLLQDDLLEIYNSLVNFSKLVVETDFPTPIKVYYEKDSRLLVFENKGTSVRLWNAIYYTLGLENLVEPTYLLPEDYDSLMYNLQTVINSGELLKDRTIISPENYGFSIYSVNIKEAWKGPELKGTIKFVSGNSWLFKLIIKLTRFFKKNR